MWELEFGRKSALTKTKFKLRQDYLNEIFTQMHSYSSFWQVLYEIVVLFTQYLHILNQVQAKQIIFLNLFKSFLFKDTNLAATFKKMAGKSLNNFKFVDFMELWPNVKFKPGLNFNK